MQATEERSAMARKIKAKRILQLRDGGLSRTAIARSTGMSKQSVCDVFGVAEEQDITYDAIRDMPDDEVYRPLFPDRNNHEPAYCSPDWEHVHKKLAKIGVTLKLLHSEYADKCAEQGLVSMGYDRFCKLYRELNLNLPQIR